MKHEGCLFRFVAWNPMYSLHNKHYVKIQIKGGGAYSTSPILAGRLFVMPTGPAYLWPDHLFCGNQPTILTVLELTPTIQ